MGFNSAFKGLIYIYIYIYIYARRIIANGITVGGEILLARPDWPWSPVQPPVQWIPGLSRVSSGRGVVLKHPPQSSAEVKERVDLYIYSLSGPS